jgi:tryptophanyl-tRNA synthetase
MVTDPGRVKREDKGHPEVCTVWAYHKIFTPEGWEEIGDFCRQAKIGCVDDKRNLAERIIECLTPIHERRAKLKKDPKAIEKILAEGAQRARIEAQKTIKEVKKVVRMI